MAKNIVLDPGEQFSATCTDPATPASGDPVLVGQIPGVALTDERTDGTTTITTRGIADVSVKAIDGVGNSAVAAGDLVYYVVADTPKLSKKNTGVRFGYALEAVTAGSTATIRVKLGY